MKKVIKEVIFAILFFAIFIFGAIYKIQLSPDTKSEEYMIPRIKDEFRGRILNFKRGKGAVFAKISNGDKILLSTSCNGDYEEIVFEGSLDEMIKNNDSIYKPIGSDSLYIYRDSKTYFFILDKFINKKK